MGKIYEFITALRNGNGYDWICINGHELNKDDLLRIIKEYDYGIYDNTEHEFQRNDLYNSIADELEEWYTEED